MLSQETTVDIVEEAPEEKLYQVTTPSGATVWLTPEEEAEAVKGALRDGLTYKLNRKMEIEKAAISSLGTAVGLAIGGFLVGMVIGKGKK